MDRSDTEVAQHGDVALTWRPFKWSMAFLHMISLIVLVVISTVVTAAVGHTDPEAAGEMAAFLTPPTAVVGLVLSWIIQKRAPWLGYGLAVLWCLVPPSFRLAGQQQEGFSKDERTLAVVGTSLVDKALRFSLPYPGRGFVPTPATAAQLRQIPSGSYMWLFINHATGESVTVLATKQSGSFEDFYAGMADGIQRELKRAGYQILMDSVTGGENPHFDLRGRSPDGPSMYMWCTASGPKRKEGLSVCISATSRELDRLNYLRDGITIR